MRLVVISLLLIAFIPPVVLGDDQGPAPGVDHPFRVCGSPEAPKNGPCVDKPKILHSPDPKYSKQARKAHLEGTVVLGVTVGVNGDPSRISVVQSLGMGLDEEAVKAVEKWKFEPATYQGRAVPVAITIEINFRLT